MVIVLIYGDTLNFTYGGVLGNAAASNNGMLLFVFFVTFLGLGVNADAGSMFRSILEAIAFEYKSYLDILLCSGALKELSCVYGVGGGAKSAVFSKIKADVLGAKYVSLENAGSAPSAMARLAAKATGYVSGDYGEIFGNEGGTAYEYENAAHAEYAEKAKRYLELLNKYSNYIS